MTTNVLEKPAASIFRVEESYTLKREAACYSKNVGNNLPNEMVSHPTKQQS
jgi:hypothetical protein